MTFLIPFDYHQDDELRVNVLCETCGTRNALARIPAPGDTVQLICRGCEASLTAHVPPASEVAARPMRRRMAAWPRWG